MVLKIMKPTEAKKKAAKQKVAKTKTEIWEEFGKKLREIAKASYSSAMKTMRKKIIPMTNQIKSKQARLGNEITNRWGEYFKELLNMEKM